MSWLLTILGLIALIILHELGHFIAAKAVGMRVERFSLFFPPTLARVRRGETEYAVGALPLGGYVKITGMTPEEIEDAEPAVAARAYCNQPPWKRIVVILAGPAVNLLIAFLIFWVILLSANYNGDLTLGNLNPSIPTLTATTRVQGVEKAMPADGALRPGDRILAVDGHHATVGSAKRAIASHRCAGAQTQGCRAATPAKLTVDRHGRVLTLSIYPRYNKEAGTMMIGFFFGAAPRQIGAVAAAGTALHEMWTTTTSLVSGIGRALTNEKARGQVHTIIGISEIADEAVAAGAGYGLVILAFISLVLAVVNLFPFLPLDGGHVVWALAEKVRGRRVSVTAMWRYSSVGIILFAFLFINGLSNDIGRLGG
ncbi:MAG TPA: M50 family metallopeptidase [Solirubrobacteraceae bacterium]|nr:M50 family metallopeptidase [Solirubrobacteraceae bacterium]